MARLSAERGVALIGVLLTLVLLLILGMGYLSQQMYRYRSAHQLRLQLEAQQLAEIGWRETELKLNKDSSFPPPADPEQKEFSFSETINESTGQRRGFYHIHIDRQFAVREQILIIRSQGEVCPPGQEQGLARYTLRLEWDLAQPSRRPFRWLMLESGAW